MKKNKKHKWKYQVNIRKKILVLVILGVFLFVGLGYSILESNLGIGGTLEVSKYDKTLYGVFKKEVNNGYATKYNGSHQDSMDSTKSTEDIYHFYAADNDNTKANAIKEKYNVVFANSCWLMYRTTDTGGVRLLYDGTPEISVVDGKTQYLCGDTRNLYHMGEMQSTLNLNNTTYKYAKNYTATTSGNTTTFTLVDDPNDPDDCKSINITSSDAQSKIEDIVANYPYTCKNSNNSCTNNSFYKIDSFSSGTIANIYTSTYRNGLGYSAYNTSYNSINYVGYMYGDTYVWTSFNPTALQDLNSSQSLIWSTSLNTNFWYSDSVTWNDSDVPNKYKLDSPYQVTSADYPNLVGKYTFRNQDQTYTSNSVYYIVAVNGSTMYYRQLSSGDNISQYNSIIFGTDIHDNGNGTYSLENETPPKTLNDWYNHYSDYNGKYMCSDGSNTCASPRYITSAGQTAYNYVSGNMALAKTRNGLVLETPIIIDYGKWYQGYNTTYSDYVYTCGNTDTTCTASNLRYIYLRNSTNYRYAKFYNYGNSVIYENNKYKLQNIEAITPATNLTQLSNHHYVCTSLGATECASVAYVYNYSVGGNMAYLTLNDPDIDSIQDVLDATLKKNATNSVIKTNIDNWYSNKFENTAFEDKIDDTIYCNDRSYDLRSGYTFAQSGFNPNGGMTNIALYFKENAITSDLSCTNTSDRFSISNNDAKLTYPVALPTTPEMNLLGNSSLRNINGQNYWLMSPLNYQNESKVRMVQQGWVDTAQNYSINQSYPLRPAISLVKGTRYSSGNGSTDNPYVVDMSE